MDHSSPWYQEGGFHWLHRNVGDKFSLKVMVLICSIHSGKLVMKSAASTLKRLTLELGGNDPAVRSCVAACNDRLLLETIDRLARR